MKTIKSKREFEQVFRGGSRAGHALVRVVALCNNSASGAVAFVAAKRLGNAVYRNRCKRVLREAARACNMPPDGCNVILFATHATHDCNPSEVAAVLPCIVKRAVSHGR